MLDTIGDFAWRTWGSKSSMTLADLLNSFPKEFAFIRQMHHRDGSFTLEQIKQTVINFHIDERSRKSSAPTLAGRGAEMAAASRSDQCHQCKAFDHYQRDCPGVAKTNGSERKPKKVKKVRSGDPSPKWCSYHKTELSQRLPVP